MTEQVIVYLLWHLSLLCTVTICVSNLCSRTNQHSALSLFLLASISFVSFLKGGEVPATATLISNEAEFGHGFTIAGCLLLHLLGTFPIALLLYAKL